MSTLNTELNLAERIDRARIANGRTQSWIISEMNKRGCKLSDATFSRRKKGHQEFSEQQLEALYDIFPELHPDKEENRGFVFWKVWCKTNKGDRRYYIARTPDTWDADMVKAKAVENSGGDRAGDTKEVMGVELGYQDNLYVEYE